MMRLVIAPILFFFYISVLAMPFTLAPIQPAYAEGKFVWKSSGLEWKEGAVTATLEGWVNATGGVLTDSQERDNPNGFGDLGLRGILTYKTNLGPTIGARLVGVDNSEQEEPDFGDRSIFIQDINRWGRIEGGWRTGLPDALYGYAPNSYTFVSAEFGPASGFSLDPDGRLPTRFLPRDTASGIDGLSYLGISAALAGDAAPKITYSTPRFKGLQAGLSIAPDANDFDGFDFGALGQIGVVYEYYYGQNNEIRIGASGSFADGEDGLDDLLSGNIGATWIWNSEIYLGASASLSDGSGGDETIPFAENADGVVVSLNYTPGAWSVGGYLQYAEAEGDPADSNKDKAYIAEIGAAWRFSEKARIFGSIYLYDFRDEGDNRDKDDGVVFLLGTRLTL